MFGSKLKEEKDDVSWGHFFCPKCNNIRPYHIKRASVDFTYYFIPLFGVGDHEKFVVCMLCKKGFDQRILERDNQTLFRLALVAKRELLQSTPQDLKRRLLRDGFKETLVEKLIIVAQN